VRYPERHLVLESNLSNRAERNEYLAFEWARAVSKAIHAESGLTHLLTTWLQAALRVPVELEERMQGKIVVHNYTVISHTL
jgi:hypothetical protein